MKKLNAILEKWRIIPKVSYVNYAKEYPTLGKNAFPEWFAIYRYWSGRLINISFRTRAIVLDFRRNWVQDMFDLSKNP